MRVGLFLDFDGVLTPKPVNMQIATLLGVEKDLIDLEKKFESGGLASADFGNALVPLFQKANFTRGFFDANFKNIQLDPYTADIIQEFRDNTFIVTSSPNYYVDRFCAKYGIPPSRYICSQYGFDAKGLIDASVKPCSVHDKEQFVKNSRDQFDLTIGVGNSIEQDGPFLSHCDVGILMSEERRDFLSVTELYSVLAMVRGIRRRHDSFLDGHLIPTECRESVRRLTGKSSYEQNVFIITPYRPDARYKVCIGTIKETLKKAGYSAYLASDFDLSLGGDLWQNVRAYMHGCKFGVAILSAHEDVRPNKTIVKPDVFNANVIAEVGYMMGHSKKVLILKDKRVKLLPTDWLGKLFVNFDLSNPEAEVKAALEKWIEDARAVGA